MEVKNFKINIERKRMAQDFNKEEITVTKAGKEINVYNFIQESREDTEIYPTLEKYGCIDRMIINEPDVYSDLRNIKDLRNSIEQVQEATKLWENLPLDIRREFGHSQKEFMEKGEKWLKNKIQEQKAQAEIEMPKAEIEMPEAEINTTTVS